MVPLLARMVPTAEGLAAYEVALMPARLVHEPIRILSDHLLLSLSLGIIGHGCQRTAGPAALVPPARA